MLCFGYLVFVLQWMIGFLVMMLALDFVALIFTPVFLAF